MGDYTISAYRALYGGQVNISDSELFESTTGIDTNPDTNKDANNNGGNNGVNGTPNPKEKSDKLHQRKDNALDVSI
jgi:hypothetical protein